MVSYCCVKGCCNNSNQKKKDPKNVISFHAFPCNQELKTKWLRAIGRPNWVPPSHARICSIHFTHDQVNYEGCRTRIKDDAIPVKSLPVNSNFEATTVAACRICLATDVKLYSLDDIKLSTCMESIVGFNENYNIEGLPQYVCYQCAALLIKCNRLVEKSMIAQATLLDIFIKHGHITKELIKQQDRDKLNINYALNYYENKDYYYCNHDSKENFDNMYQDFINSSLRNENEVILSESDADIENNIETCNIESVETNPNEELNNLSDNDLDNCMDSPIEDCTSMQIDHEVVEEEEVEEDLNMKKKEVNLEGRPAPTKLETNNVDDLSPEEIEMQKYFDVVRLSLQEQIIEWKKAVKGRMTSKNVYECGVCSKAFVNLSSCETHVLGHDPERGDVECKVCKIRFKSDVVVKSHANRAHAKKFSCKLCPKVYVNVGGAKKHHLWHVGHRYRCGLCSYSSSHSSGLSLHMRTHASAYTCALCAQPCASARGLGLHMATAHRGLKDSQMTKEYKCEQCDIMFVSEGARRVHLLTAPQHANNQSLCDSTSESAELRNTCNKCGVQCTSSAELVAHKRSEHPKRGDNYSTNCELCGESVHSRREHWFHMRRQHPKQLDMYRPDVAAVCDTCGKGFQNSAKLAIHQLRHSAPTLQCDSCPRMFYDKYALSQHSLTHTDHKSHLCRTCGRAFKLKGNLERHSKVHSEVTPYECTLCGKKFKHISSVNLHKRTVHYKLPHPPRKKRNKAEKNTSANVNNCNM